MVPLTPIIDPDLSNGAFRVLALLAAYADPDGVCWPSAASLAARLGLARPTVVGYLQELGRRGYILSERRTRENGSDTSNLYRIVRGAEGVSVTPTPGVGRTDTTAPVPPQGGVGPIDSVGPADRGCRKPTDTQNIPLEQKTPSPSERAATKRASAQPGAKPTTGPGTSPVKRMFDLGKDLLAEYGIDCDRARNLIGRWRKDASDQELIDIFRSARRARRQDIVAYISGAIRRGREDREIAPPPDDSFNGERTEAW